MARRSDRYELGRIERRPYRAGGLDRQQRLFITMGVGAAVMLLLGAGIGFAAGRMTAPRPEPEPVPVAVTTMPAGVEEPVPAPEPEPEPALEPTESIEATATDETPPPTPRQLAPANGATVDASRVYLRWSEVTDGEGPVTYAFEIQDRSSSGSWVNRQVITGLTSTSYSARVLPARRRWRVWAVDAAGNESPRSGWRTYTKKASAKRSTTPAPPAPQPEPEPSDETT